MKKGKKEEMKTEQIVEIAHYAPSACNSQPWKMHVICEPEMVKDLSACLRDFGMNQFTKEVPAFIVVSEVDAKLAVGSKLKYDNNTPYLDGKLKLWVKISDTDFPQSISQIATIGRLSENMLNKAANYAHTTLNSLFEKTKSYGCDIFESKNMLYRFYNSRFESENKDFLSNLKCNFSVTCQNYI